MFAYILLSVFFLKTGIFSFFLLYLLCISIPYRRSYHVYIVASFQHSVFLIPLSVVFRSFNRNLLAPIPYSRFQIR